jgi:hypothetical protein
MTKQFSQLSPSQDSGFLRHSSLVLRHFLRIRRSRFRHDYKCDANDDQEEGKELSARERADQLRIGFAEIFNHDAKDRVADEKQSG